MYQCRPKYRGAGSVKVCIATKNTVNYYATRIPPPDTPGHHCRIVNIQNSIPRMARLVGPFDDVILAEEATGTSLWDLDSVPDCGRVERELVEFAHATQEHNLIHGDLRPWNVYYDDRYGVQVIDWVSLSSFVDDLIGQDPRRHDLTQDQNGVKGHYWRFHPALIAQQAFTEIDVTDARLIGKLLKGEMRRLRDAWPDAHRLEAYPKWCPVFCTQLDRGLRESRRYGSFCRGQPAITNRVISIVRSPF